LEKESATGSKKANNVHGNWPSEPCKGEKIAFLIGYTMRGETTDLDAFARKLSAD